MNNDRLHNIKYRLQQATQGSWVRGIGNDCHEVSNDKGLLIATFRNPSDGTLAADAPDDLRWCIKEIERLRKIVGEYRCVNCGTCTTLEAFVAKDGSTCCSKKCQEKENFRLEHSK